MESVGFKEWALVCEALGRGEQTIIVRKGGIAEGREGFSFRYREFFLFPTFFHEQLDKVRGESRDLPERTEGVISLRYFARLELAAAVTSFDVAMALQPFHILQPDVIHERFHYDAAPGVHVAFVRIYRLAVPWNLPDERRYGGCRSWVQLAADAGELRLNPVLDDAEHWQRLHQFADLVGANAGMVPGRQ